MTSPLTLSELRKLAAAGTVDTVLACIVDMQGRLIGKRFQVEFFLDVAHEETHGCDYLLADDIDMEPVPGYAAASWKKGYGDFVFKPDLSTLRLVPWVEGAALVLCDVQDHHQHDLPHSPRGILKRQIARLEERGFKGMFASELEFYVFDESYETIHKRNYHQPKTANYNIEDYAILQTIREEPVMRAIRRNLQAAGIPVENSKGEWGPGQEEINVVYADALTMADRHSIIKHACKEIAMQHGKALTFMAKWRYDLAGSSCHIHNSLWSLKGNKALFHDAKAEYGMSTLMRQWVAGQLKYARDISYFLAPYINSYKRFQVGTFAPTRAVWSRDNRTAGFRLCGEGGKAVRIECRIGGADLNPYLAYAALIAAGLAGIDEQLELGKPYEGDAYQNSRLPEVAKTLRDAAAALKGSKMLKQAFGDEVVAHYLHTANWEQLEYDRRVTDWELRRGFERY